MRSRARPPNMAVLNLKKGVRIMISGCQRCKREIETPTWFEKDSKGKVLPVICPHCGHPNKPKLHRRTPTRYQ